jgi:hypothetical protein
MAAEEFDKDWHRTSLNHHLRLLGRAGSDVGQCPSSLELNQSVGGSQEFDKSADNAGLNDALDRWVPLFRKQLPELGGGLDLLVNLFRKDPLDHLRKLFVQLLSAQLARSCVG